MTNQLSYPGLRCVLEYLEANRRIHITARSPALRRIEKSIPIHLEFLKICNKIDLNDIQMEVYFNNRIMFKRGNKECFRPCPIGLIYGEARKKIKMYYLEGRMCIYADRFWFSNNEGKNFPKFNVTTNDLTVSEFEIGDILQYINPNSFPLKELTIKYFDGLIHPHICSAKKLCFDLSDDQRNGYATSIVAIQNKNIEMEYEILEYVDVMGIIRQWVENGKETDSTLVCYGHYGDRTDEIVTELRNKFSEIMSELAGVDDQTLTGTPGFSIPLTTSSKILVYQRGNLENFSEEIVLKVVSNQAGDRTMEMEHQ